MMAAHANKWPVLVITFVLFSHLLSGAVNASQCVVDGTYDHGGLKCCKCATGLYVKSHCTANLQLGECEFCDVNTFSSEPTGQTQCEPCRSCSDDTANLEVEENCTRGANTKCRCKKDHYCIRGTDTCKECSPCTKCPDGIKKLCKGFNDTVCNEKKEVADNNTGTIVGTVFGLLAAVVVGVAVWCYCRRKRGQNPPSQHQNGDIQNPDVELVEVRPLIKIPNMDLQPHLPDLAEVIGWTDMKAIAIRSEISMTRIENCELNHPHDAGEQTVELLDFWVQSQGFAAGNRLYQTLEKIGKKLKAEKVRDILLLPRD